MYIKTPESAYSPKPKAFTTHPKRQYTHKNHNSRLYALVTFLWLRSNRPIFMSFVPYFRLCRTALDTLLCITWIVIIVHIRTNFLGFPIADGSKMVYIMMHLQPCVGSLPSPFLDMVLLLEASSSSTTSCGRTVICTTLGES